MSDIFEIKTTKVEIKIGERVFEIKDPKFVVKINLKKQWDALTKQQDGMGEDEFSLKAYELSKQSIIAFIPDITSEFIDNEIPSSALEILNTKISEIAADKFGAVIEKVEKK